VPLAANTAQGGSGGPGGNVAVGGGGMGSDANGLGGGGRLTAALEQVFARAPFQSAFEDGVAGLCSGHSVTGRAAPVTP
jgi:hypothetical protein